MQLTLLKGLITKTQRTWWNHSSGEHSPGGYISTQLLHLRLRGRGGRRGRTIVRVGGVESVHCEIVCPRSDWKDTSMKP